MTQCTVELKHATPLIVCADAIRECWGSQDRSDNGGPKDRELIYRVGCKNNHSSTLEHLNYTFRITDFSRAVLQELSRHRHASPSVRSTRYTLKELKKEEEFSEGTYVGEPAGLSSDLFGNFDANCVYRAKKYLVFTGDNNTDAASILALDTLRILVQRGIANDISKYALPESYKVSETITINMRSLQNFLGLRTSKAALWEIREVAYSLYNALPEDHKYLCTDYLYMEKPKDVTIELLN